MFLKKVFLTAIMIFTLMIFQSANAKDLYVDSWWINDSHYNLVIVSDSIDYGDNDSGRWLSVTTKNLRNGVVYSETYWNFDDLKHGGDWRYKTDTMKGHTCRVLNVNGEMSPQEKLLRFCLNYIGKPY